MANRVVFGLWTVVACAALVAACSRDDGGNAAPRTTPTVAASLPVPTQPNFFAGPPDDSRSIVQRNVRVEIAQATLSAPFRDIPNGAAPEEGFEHEPLRSPLAFAQATRPDPVVQSFTPAVTPLIMAIHSFLGQGDTLGGCIFPKPDAGEPPGCTTTGDPPDTNGAVGPNHFVQTVNGGVAVWDKSGNVLMTPKYLKTLWAGYTGTNTGNACATQNDGDPVVLYDQLADRWFITQFSLPNFDNGTGPAFQCVAVSQTGDPTGAYYLYDYQYNVEINDYGKFGVWPDAYYASFNNFNPNSQGANACAYDRVSMLAGKPAAQHCFQQSPSVFGLLPSSVDGQIKPPNGEPGFFISLKNGTSLSLYKFHVDWTTPANSTFTGPTSIPVASYSQLCGGNSCITQPSPGNALASLGDRPMFHLSYRNFGTLESLVFNHSVTAGSSGAPRWYEIRSPNATPVVFQQGTYAPDASFRWMGSIAQDMAQDFALGYSISSATTDPAIAWTGRTASDTAGTMGQAEVVVQNGVGVETGKFSNGQTASRWGDYSNMSVDPADDCTFWYTQERYPSNGIFNWDTGIMSGKFANCGANDFSIALTPASDTVGQTGTMTATFTVSTSSIKGAAETIALVVQDLPSGVTAAFVPTSVTAGGSAVLTLTATATTPVTASPDTFMVIGKASSAVRAATAQVSVVTCKKLTSCPSPDNCGSIADGCGGTVSCGTGCTLPQTCGGGGTNNVCGCTPTKMCPVGANCGSVDNGCGTMISCGGACGTSQSCVANVCTNIPPDLSMPADLAMATAPDLSTANGGDLATASGDDLAVGDNGDLATGGGGGGGTIGGGGNGGGGGSGGKGGCGCVVGGAHRGGEGPLGALAVVLVLGLALARRRARRIGVQAAPLSGI